MSLMLHEMLVGPTVPLATYIATSFIGSSTSSTLPLPTGTQAGDLVVFFDGPSSPLGSVPPFVLPTGFTLISDQSTPNGGSNGIRETVSYRVVDAADVASGSITGSLVAGQVTRSIAITFRYSQPISSVSIIGLLQSTVDAGVAQPPQVLNISQAQPFISFQSMRMGIDGSSSTSTANQAPTSNSGRQRVYYRTNVTSVNDSISYGSAIQYRVLTSFGLVIT